MTRHQKNATASTVYTHHERKKDQKASGWGTLEERLAKNAVKDFDCCSLTLQRCREPVVTPEGNLFEYEALLKYILHHKTENSRKKRLYHEQLAETDRERQEEEMELQAKKVRLFEAAESTPARSANPGDYDEPTTSRSETSITTDPKKMTSFWVPTLAGSVKTSVSVQPPDSKVLCPISGKPLKVKDLVHVKFKLSNDFKSADTSSAKDIYVCALTGDSLTNATPCVVLKTSGYVVTVEALEKVIRKDMIDPFNGKKINEKTDLIYLRRGGTGFSATNENLKSKLLRPALELQ